MGHQNRFILILGLVFNFILLPRAFAETYTDDMIQDFFKSKDARKSHGVMKAQRESIRAIMDGFIIGDPELIQRNADDLNTAMQEIVQTYPPKSEEGAAVWSAMSNIVTQSQSMKKELSNKDYSKAYGHYTQITASCIQCHQIARPWGKFEEPPTEVKKVANADETVNSQDDKLERFNGV